MNQIQVWYQCIGGATSVDLPVKWILATLFLVWYCVYSGTCIYVAIGYTLRIGGVLFFTTGTCGVSTTTLGTGGVNCSILKHLLLCCGRLVSGGFTAQLNISDIFKCQIVQVLQLLMVIPVLGFKGMDQL